MTRVLILTLVASTLIGKAYAVAVGSPLIKPDSIQLNGLQSEVMTCPHFRARLRNEFETISEFKWRFRHTANPQQIDRYFENRLAADPYDFAGIWAAKVKWAVPIEVIKRAAQVYAIDSLGETSFSGAQMHFEFRGQSIKRIGNSLIIESPVRMLDVCLNGYLNLSLYSECPVHYPTYWRPGNKKKIDAPTIDDLKCKSVQKIRLDLSGVQSALERGKLSLHRSGGDHYRFGTDLKMKSCGDSAQAAANLLQALTVTKRLHNCSIEVVKKAGKIKTQFSIYARDDFACAHSAFACLEDEFSFEVPNSCLARGSEVPTIVRYSSGVNLKNKYETDFIGSQLNRQGQLMRLVIGRIDMNTGRRVSFVNCRPDIFRGENL